jgi:NAD(P)-dependent dehydrogenase (short-subunit alcohol dehydrogenase family)
VRRPGWYLSVIQILNANQIPDQSGRIAVITGGGAGLGRETAKALAEKAATVVLAVRSRPERSTARIVPLDLASLSSVRAGAEEILTTCDRLDLLIKAASTTVPQAPSSTPAAPRGWNRALDRTIRRRNAGCGRCRSS